MPPKVTADEQRQQRLLQYIINTGNIYSNQTIEQASKPTGISGMQIKAVVQSLADEGLVDTDRIGASMYYWRFKSKESQSLIQKLEDMQQQILNSNKELQDLIITVESEKVKRQRTPRQQELDTEFSILHKEVKELESRLNEYEKVNYQQYQSYQQDTEIALKNANQWTDIVFILKKYLMKKFNMDGKQIDRQLQINEAFDYIE